MSEEKRRSCRTQNRYNDDVEGSMSNNKKMNARKSFPSSSHDVKHQHYGMRDTYYNNSSRGTKDRNHNASTPKSGSRSVSNYGKNSAVSNGHEVVYQESNSSEQSFTGLEQQHNCVTISAPGLRILSSTEAGESKIFFKPDFIEKNEGYKLLEKLAKEVDWLDKKVVIDGEERRQPRLVAWYGPLPYSYSGVTLDPREFSPTILAIKKDVERVLKAENINVELNSVLLNLYRDGKDSVAWHADDELSMGIEPTIASVSLGETRRFELRKKPMEHRSQAPAEFVVHLNHGSLIVMDGVMQLDWQHRVPKEFHDRDKRINLTFRTVYPIENVRHSASSLLRTRSYIPPPRPAEPSAPPFELQPEAFPALGNDISPPRQSSMLSKTDKRISGMPKVDLDDVVMSKNDAQFTGSLNEYIRHDMVEPMTIAGDVHSASSTRDDRVMEDCKHDVASVQIPNSTGDHVAKELKVITSEPQNVNREDSPKKLWNNLDKVQEFIPKVRNVKDVTNANIQLSENQYSSTEDENNTSTENIRHNRNNYPRFSPSKSNTRGAESSKAYARRMNQVGIENNEFQNCSNEAEIVDRLNEVYDYITGNWDSLNFTVNQSHELEVHLSVVEHAKGLPFEVLELLTGRMEHLIHQAEKAERRQYSYYNQRKPNENYSHKRIRGRNDSRY